MNDSFSTCTDTHENVCSSALVCACRGSPFSRDQTYSLLPSDLRCSLRPACRKACQKQNPSAHLLLPLCPSIQNASSYKPHDKSSKTACMVDTLSNANAHLTTTLLSPPHSEPPLPNSRTLGAFRVSSGEEGEKEDGDDGSTPPTSSTPPVPSEGKIDGESLPMPVQTEEGSGDVDGGAAKPETAGEGTPALLHLKIEMDLGLSTRCVMMTSVMGKVAFVGRGGLWRCSGS